MFAVLNVAKVYNGLSYYSANLNVSSHLGFFISSAVEVSFVLNLFFISIILIFSVKVSGSLIFSWLVGYGQMGATLDSL